MVKGEDSRCNVILIAGFLGAGKTTLLRNILKWPGDLSKTAILVNEFGKIGIDGELLKGLNTPIYELTNGCICCTIQGDLLRTLQEILVGFRPRRIFVEATGVADPFDVLASLNCSQLKEHIHVRKVVTVLNGELWEGREYFGPLFYNQIKAAELLLFNKVDLLAEEDVPHSLREIREINPSASVVPTHYCLVDPEIFWGPSCQVGDDTEFDLSHVHTAHQNDEEMGYVTFAFENQAPFKTPCFHRFVERLPVNLYRMKGFVLVDGKYFLLNHVGGKTEWKELDEVGPTRLAFVGWEVDEGQILEALRMCLEDDKVQRS